MPQPLGPALQTTIDAMRSYVEGLSPSERAAFGMGLRASHFEEALVQGDWPDGQVFDQMIATLRSDSSRLERKDVEA